LSVLEPDEDVKVPRLDIELTTACDHRCAHCYNVWGADAKAAGDAYPKGQLPTDEIISMLGRVVRQSGARHLTLTGGEPMLRRDAMDIVAAACALVPSVQLVTNGSHISPEVAKELRKHGLRSVQLTLLSADRERHDAMKGVECYDDTVRAAVDLREAGVPVQICFVAVRDNAGELPGVLELCYVLGIGHLAYNRMSPSGGAVAEVSRLMPTVEQVERDLGAANRLGRRFGIKISTAMPIPPCLIRIERYPWVRFGFCSTGTKTPNITVDALGNVRSCNLSSNVLGNVLEQEWSEIYGNPYPRTFRTVLPAPCVGCAYETSCNGGCKEAAIATFGDPRHLEPFVHLARGKD
jgi:radical SAM protein with 4Fe4S-binding SPASM domain